LTFFIGCVSRSHQVPIIEKKTQPALQKTQKTALPPAPKKHIQLKEVDDTNHSDTYMYPEDTAAAKKDPVKTTEVSTVSNGMTKEECISMISQEKFDKYTNMFGSEAASIKRCAMLKSMSK
jgi:hypothetical protein